MTLHRKADGTVDPIWIAEMAKLIGIREVIDGQLNPVIRAMFAATHYPPDQVGIKTSWCSAALCSVMEKLGLPHTHSAAAMSWLSYGVECEAKPGAIAVFEFHLNHGTGPTDHHVSIVTGIDADQLICLGGNQSNSVRRSWYPKAAVLGYRFPA